MMPTPTPRMISPGQNIFTPAMGMRMYNQSIASLLSSFSWFPSGRRMPYRLGTMLRRT
jgi:hypothetical protein